LTDAPSTKLSQAIQERGLAPAAGVDILLDSCVIMPVWGLLRKKEENRGAEERGGLTRADLFVKRVTRHRQAGTSYVSLYELLDPEREKQALKKPRKREMYERLGLLKAMGLVVVTISPEASVLALDMWFDARQGRLSRLSAPKNLQDPLIAGTAVELGITLYTANVKDFKGYADTYGLIIKELKSEGAYLGIT